LEDFFLELEPDKTRLAEFGRFALRHAKERGKEDGDDLFPGVYPFLYP